jgi:hypothetical protein
LSSKLLHLGYWLAFQTKPRGNMVIVQSHRCVDLLKPSPIFPDAALITNGSKAAEEDIASEIMVESSRLSQCCLPGC